MDMQNEQTNGVQKGIHVRQILGNDRELSAMASDISMDGIQLDMPAELLSQIRYMWLEFGLPESNRKIRALGEITERSAFSVKVRFKHIFPDQKRALAQHLQAGVSLN